jgi:hypothetical protein
LLFPDLQRVYRPENVLRYLADQPNLGSYLVSLGADPELPADAMTAIAKLRG